MKKEWKTEQEKPQSIVVLRDSNGNSNEYVLPQGFYVARCVGGFEMIYDADSKPMRAMIEYAQTLSGVTLCNTK